MRCAARSRRTGSTRSATAGGERRERARAEQRHGLQECDQRAGNERGKSERNGHSPRRGPGAPAEYGGSVFKVAGNATERVGEEHEHVRKRVARNDEDEPAKRVDVEEVLVLRGACDPTVDLVEETA